METLLATFDPVARWTAARLVEGSLQSALLVVLVWVICRVTTIPPKARAVLWWVASAKLVLSLLAIPGLPLRVLPAVKGIEQTVLLHPDEPTVPPLMPTVRPSLLVDDRSSSGIDGSVRARIVTAPASRDISSLDVLIGFWFLVVLVHAAVLFASSRRVRRVVAGASPVSAQETGEVAALAHRVRVRPPLVVISDAVTSPQAVGVWRPAILLPAGFAAGVTPEEWRMAVCHELMHLRRRDLLWGWVPAIAERLFFFHPLARVASDQYLVAREAACDAAVVQALDVDAHDYGRMLVHLGVSRASPGFAASVASPSASLLRRRLEMLQQFTSTGTSRAHWIIAAAAIALVPFHLTAQSPRPLDPQGLIVAPTAAAAAQSSVDSADNRLQRQREAQNAIEIARKASAQAQSQALEADRLELERRLLESRAQQEQARAEDERRSRDRDAADQQRALDALKEARSSQRLLAQQSAEGAAESARRSERLALESALERLKEQQDLLSQTLNAQHPDRIAAERKLEEALAQLRQSQLSQQSIPGTTQSPALQRRLDALATNADVAGSAALREEVAKLQEEVRRLRTELDALKRAQPVGPRSDAGRGVAPQANLRPGGFDQRELERVMASVSPSLPEIFDTAMRASVSDALKLRAQLAARYTPMHPSRLTLDSELWQLQERLSTATKSVAALKDRAASDYTREQVQASLADLQRVMKELRDKASQRDDTQQLAQILDDLREQRLEQQKQQAQAEEIQRRLTETSKRLIESGQLNNQSPAR